MLESTTIQILPEYIPDTQRMIEALLLALDLDPISVSSNEEVLEDSSDLVC